MEINILDALLRRSILVDAYESFIWTERWQGAGDFELELKATSDNRSYFDPGTWLSIPSSNRVMEVETVEDRLSADGVTTLIIKGRSLEATIMENRVAMKNTRTTPPAEDRWITGTTDPYSMAFYIWEQICILGTFNSLDIVPNQVGSSQPLTLGDVGTMPRPTDQIKYNEPALSLYDAMDKLCKAYNLGYKIIRYEANQLLRFCPYMGTNRTTQQTAVKPVIFSPYLETIQNVTTLRSTVGAKNVAYVFSPADRAVVYADGVDPNVTGFERRVLMVLANDLNGKGQLPDGQTGEPPTLSPAELRAQLVQRGREALAKQRNFLAIDGEIDPYGSYQYNKDYELGDIVEMRDLQGVTNSMRVTEHIFVSDASGERSYPTLSRNTFIYPGDWKTMNTRTWLSFDADTTSVWSNQP
jgi:hypothetical protein